MLSLAARQVEVRRAAHLRGLPLAVVQYNPLGDLQSFAPDDPHRHMNHSNGSLIAVGYEARKHGVKRCEPVTNMISLVLPCTRSVDQRLAHLTETTQSQTEVSIRLACDRGQLYVSKEGCHARI